MENGRVRLDLNSVIVDGLSHEELWQSLSRISAAGRIRLKNGFCFVVNVRSLTIIGSKGKKRTQYNKYYKRSYRRNKRIITNLYMNQNLSVTVCGENCCNQNWNAGLSLNFVFTSVDMDVSTSVDSRSVSLSKSIDYDTLGLQACNVNGLQENANITSVGFVENGYRKNLDIVSCSTKTTSFEFQNSEKKGFDNASKSPPSTPREYKQNHVEEFVCVSGSEGSNGGTGGKEGSRHAHEEEFSFQVSNQFHNANGHIKQSPLLTSETPNFDEAKKVCDRYGIPFEFGKDVYLKWWEREGKDGYETFVDFPRHVQSRWLRAQQDWVRGTHYLQRNQSGNTNSQSVAQKPNTMAAPERPKAAWQIAKEIEMLDQEIKNSFANPNSTRCDPLHAGYAEEKKRIIKLAQTIKELRRLGANSIAGI